MSFKEFHCLFCFLVKSMFERKKIIVGRSNVLRLGKCSRMPQSNAMSLFWTVKDTCEMKL